MFKKLKRIVKTFLCTPPIGTWEQWFRLKGVDVRGKLNVYGRPNIIRWGSPSIIVEDGVTFDSDPVHNDAGIVHPCTLAATSSNAIIHIGRESGMSGALICSQKKVWIGERVWLGANVTIYDTDFHPINPYDRFFAKGESLVRSKEVVIDDYVWVGANAMILKGVHIGKGAVIGAGSVVACNVPELTVYAGNPAKFVKNIEMTPEQYEIVFGK